MKNWISYPFEAEKAANTVLWLLHQHGGRLSVLKLVKLIFFADRLHLIRYGRPIFGGRYSALPHGPVPSELYETMSKAGDATKDYRRVGYDLEALNSYNEEYLAESDLEVLSEINKALGSKDKWALRDLSHELKPWKNNFKADGEDPRESFAIPYEDFFADFPPEKMQMLEIMKEDEAARASIRDDQIS